jgi:hypothetical protein
MADKTVRVKMKAPFRVVHEGEPHSDGDQFEVPEDVAAQWERSGFVERVSASSSTQK